MSNPRRAVRGWQVEAALFGRGVNEFLPLAAHRVGLAALLSLQHEGVAAIEVDPPGRAICPSHRALEHIVVLFGDGAGRLGSGHADNVAQLRQEQGIVGAFRAAHPVRPPVNEFFDLQASCELLMA